MLSLVIKYDCLKEEKQLLEAKQQELKRIEEAKQKVANQGKENINKNGNKKWKRTKCYLHLNIIFLWRHCNYLTNMRESYYMGNFNMICMFHHVYRNFTSQKFTSGQIVYLVYKGNVSFLTVVINLFKYIFIPLIAIHHIFQILSPLIYLYFSKSAYSPSGFINFPL